MTRRFHRSPSSLPPPYTATDSRPPSRPPPPSLTSTTLLFCCTRITMTNQQDAQMFNWHYTELDNHNLELRSRKVLFTIFLFCLILLIILLFICARWICRYRDHLPTTFHSSQVRHAASPPSQGLDLDSIKKLPIILHQALSDSDCALEETECCICLSVFEDGEKLKVLPGCKHCFHCQCVDNWLINHSSCPLCRASIKVDVDSSSFPEILIQEPPIRIDLQLQNYDLLS